MEIEPTTANETGLHFRGRLAKMFATSPLPPDDKMFNLFLYARSSLLVKALVLDDIYKRILDIPGALVEFGVWNGQTMVLLENLRAIHEPFNKSRKIIGFDSFEGYPDGGYQGSMSPTALEQLLEVHEGCNAFGHLRGNHEVVVCDAKQAAARFADDPMPIALAIFDIGTYEATAGGLNAVIGNVVPGSVLLFDELYADGEGRAWKQMVDRNGFEYKIEKCALYPSKTIVTLK